MAPTPTPQAPAGAALGSGASRPRRAALALLLLVPAPTLGVLFAMHWLPDTTLGQSIHLSAKVWLLALPLVWVLLVERGRLRLPRWSWRGMPAGLITGLLTMGAIIGGWELVGRSLVDVAVMREKIAEVGLDTPMKYLAFAAAVTFINALLEEYVWRWFVYSKWFEVLARKRATAGRPIAVPGAIGLPPRRGLAGWLGLPGAGAGVGAIALAGLCFVLHHTVAMSVYFDWQANALASLGIFIGSVTWSVIYLRYRNIYAGYVSHIFADIGLFVVGYMVAFG